MGYDIDVTKVGDGSDTGGIAPTLSGGTVSVLDAIDTPGGRRLWRFRSPDLSDGAARPLVVNETIFPTIYAP